MSLSWSLVLLGPALAWSGLPLTRVRTARWLAGPMILAGFVALTAATVKLALRHQTGL
jgi:hypothetical protein